MTGDELRDMRLMNRMTLKDIGDKLGVSLSLISLWERGKTPIPSEHKAKIMKMIKKIKSGENEDRSENRTCQTVELGPETMKAISDLVLSAVTSICNGRSIAIRPEVIQSARDGDRHRARTQEILDQGW